MTAISLTKEDIFGGNSEVGRPAGRIVGVFFSEVIQPPRIKDFGPFDYCVWGLCLSREVVTREIEGFLPADVSRMSIACEFVDERETWYADMFEDRLEEIRRLVPIGCEVSILVNEAAIFRSYRVCCDAAFKLKEENAAAAAAAAAAGAPIVPSDTDEFRASFARSLVSATVHKGLQPTQPVFAKTFKTSCGVRFVYVNAGVLVCKSVEEEDEETTESAAPSPKRFKVGDDAD